nr:inactive beta-amylase 9 [Ipomoea batatas]
MEVSMIGSSQAHLGSSDLGSREVGVCSFGRNFNAKTSSLKNPKLCFGQTFSWPSRTSACLSLKASAASQTEAVVSDKVCGAKRSKPIDSVKLYVGLPMDTVSVSNTINHARAIAAGLKALKLLGVDGVELPIWWGIAEKEAMGKYDWTGYLAVAEMIQKLGLKLHVSLCFHASMEHKISLPEWVCQIGESDPSIFFTDRSGHQYKDCLSLVVDDLPVLDGKTPLQVYKGFCESFKSAFSKFMDSTITGISIGLGPDGELRYPSHHQPAKSNHKHVGAGEFQCYDKNMLSHLKQHAEMFGNPLWGHGGPHDAPACNEPPISNNFFKEHGGSWETTYGDFFLSWYSNQLITHGDQLLSVGASTFSDVPQITVSGKVPLIHCWYKTRSHPAELVAGIYNTENRDGYEAIVEMFSKNKCKIILPGMDLSDEQQPKESLSSPESLLAQVTLCCRKHGVEILGQNSTASNAAASGFEQISKNLAGESAAAISLFTYQRMGAYFFSPNHFPSFTKFMRNLRELELELDSDDQPGKEETTAGSSLSARNLQEQAA